MKSIFKISLVIFLILSFFLGYSCKKDPEIKDDIIRDVDGNVYTSAKIGTQVWIVENLKTTKYSNGDLIGTTNPASKNISTESTPKYQWANEGNESNVATFGRLYTWYAITDNRKVCPNGWHLPSDAEWKVLELYLGMSQMDVDKLGLRGTNEGGKLKEIGTTHWLSPNTGATDDYGFKALPGGYRDGDGVFRGTIGYYGLWWSSTENSAATAFDRYFQFDLSHIKRDYDNKMIGMSVRCVKD